MIVEGPILGWMKPNKPFTHEKNKPFIYMKNLYGVEFLKNVCPKLLCLSRIMVYIAKVPQYWNRVGRVKVSKSGIVQSTPKESKNAKLLVFYL